MRDVPWAPRGRILERAILALRILHTGRGRSAILERGSFRDESMTGGNQPTNISMIHRRCIAHGASRIDLKEP